MLSAACGTLAMLPVVFAGSTCQTRCHDHRSRVSYLGEQARGELDD
jgi:hypothetical protein